MGQKNEVSGYWNRTDQIKKGAGGGHPTCRGEKMVAADDPWNFPMFYQ